MSHGAHAHITNLSGTNPLIISTLGSIPAQRLKVATMSTSQSCIKRTLEPTDDLECLDRGKKLCGARGSEFFAQIAYEDPYVQPLILSALEARLLPTSYEIIQSLPSPFEGRLLQVLPYEKLAFNTALQNPGRLLINAYVIRKALIRKHFLATTVHSWITKHPYSSLKDHVKPAIELELDYAEFLDEALLEAFEVRDSLANNEELPGSDREWWILKPSMSDRGQGIRLFSSEAELTNIFEEWEAEQESDTEDEDNDCIMKDHSSNINASQLRHFVAQPYIHPPLLLPSSSNRKFHIRTYVVAVGALKVYVYKPMLALFAVEAYAAPWKQPDLRAHLTNTCLQGTNEREGSVRAFWDLEEDIPGLPSNWKSRAFEQMCGVTGELFEAAARNMLVHFQALPCSFEIFGLDFLVDASGTPWLLEVNAFPDFKQTGEDLKDLVHGLFEELVDVAVKPFFGITELDDPAKVQRMFKVLDIDLGRR
jgi:tubulin---tyrosine ligase